MAKLYIANCTLQPHDFTYRIPEDTRLKMQRIEPGGQITVFREDTIEMLRPIVEQHEKYGLVDAATLDQTKPFIGLCYSFDKPVKVEKFMYANAHNEGILQQRGQEVRRIQAAATAASIEQHVGADRLHALQAEIVVESGADKGVNEVIEVDRQAAASGGDKPRVPRRGKKAS